MVLNICRAVFRPVLFKPSFVGAQRRDLQALTVNHSAVPLPMECLARLNNSIFFQRIKYGKHNAFNIIHHIIIPKADYFVALRFQVSCSLRIIFCLPQVLTTVQFDDEFGFGATEVRDVVANGMLPAEGNA